MDSCKKPEMTENAFQNMYSIIAVKQQKRKEKQNDNIRLLFLL